MILSRISGWPMPGSPPPSSVRTPSAEASWPVSSWHRSARYVPNEVVDSTAVACRRGISAMMRSVGRPPIHASVAPMRRKPSA